MLRGEVAQLPHPSCGKALRQMLHGSLGVSSYAVNTCSLMPSILHFFAFTIQFPLPNIVSRNHFLNKLLTPKFCFCLESKKTQKDIVHTLKQENRSINRILTFLKSIRELKLQDYQVNQMTSLSKEKKKSMAERDYCPESVKENKTI